MQWPRIEEIEAGRVRLEPLSVEHAVPMADVLADVALYRFIGGQPPTLPELRQRYAAQAVGHSEDGAQWWLNWIVMLADPARTVGYVQATVEEHRATLEADLAWVISPEFHGQGLASEAAGVMRDWLKARGVERFVAHVHPAHAASQSVARKLGLHPTPLIEDGEVRWQSHAP